MWFSNQKWEPQNGSGWSFAQVTVENDCFIITQWNGIPLLPLTLFLGVFVRAINIFSKIVDWLLLVLFRFVCHAVFHFNAITFSKMWGVFVERGEERERFRLAFATAIIFYAMPFTHLRIDNSVWVVPNKRIAPNGDINYANTESKFTIVHQIFRIYWIRFGWIRFECHKLPCIMKIVSKLLNNRSRWWMLCYWQFSSFPQKIHYQSSVHRISGMYLKHWHTGNLISQLRSPPH